MFRIGFPGDTVVKNLPAKQKMPVPSVGQEDPLQKEMAPHSAFLSGKSHGQRSLVDYSPIQFSPVAQSRPTLRHPMDGSTPGLPVHHWLPEFTQTHLHWVGDAIQPSHPLSSPSPPAFNLSQLQGLFKWASSSHLVAKVFEFQSKGLQKNWIWQQLNHV